MVDAANFHLTLAFIGATPPEQLAAVCALGAKQRAHAASLRFDALDYWPKPEVLVARARAGDDEFERLSSNLYQGLAALGFSLQPKSWRPHVTLLRKLVVAPPPFEFAPIDWLASEFVLAESHDVPVIVEAVTDYVARRMIEREHALAAIPTSVSEERQRPRRRAWGMFVLGFLFGAAALFGLALYASLKNF